MGMHSVYRPPYISSRNSIFLKNYQEHQKIQCRIGLKIDPSPEDLEINFSACFL